MPNRSLMFVANELNIEASRFSSDESLAAEVFKAITGLKGEVARLKEGKFTEEELQNLCHNLTEDDKQKFCDGCDEYQRNLFGICRTDLLVGTITNWAKTCERHEKRILQLEETEKKFDLFKKLVHDTLDGIGVPKFENEQCRIKPRLEALVEHIAMCKTHGSDLDDATAPGDLNWPS